MCSRIVKSGLILLTVFILGSANLQAKAAEDKPYKWRMATSYSAGSPLYINMPEAFAKQVEEMSGGRMKIKVLPGGTVAPPLETTNAVQKGIVEMGHTWPGYDIGRDPTTVLLAGYPGSMESLGMIHWLYEGGGVELWQQFRLEKFGVMTFVCGITPPEAFAHSHKPLRTLKDFKGFKMRTVGAWAQILPKLGTSVISLPSAEVYQALERKIIDGTEYSTPGLNIIIGLHEVAKYVIVPGAHQPTTTLELAISKEKWDALPADLKAIIEQAAIDTTFMAWVKFGQLDMKALDTLEKNGNEIIFLEPAVQHQIHKLGKEWARTHAVENEWFRKIFDSQEAFEKQWKTVANIRYLEN